jgi:hypothetical protein
MLKISMFKLFSLKKIALLTLVLCGVFTFFPFGVHAISDCPPSGEVPVEGCIIANPMGSVNDIPGLICVFIRLLTVTLMPPIMVLMVLYASFLLLTSVGEPAKFSQARSMILYTMIGAIVLIMAVPLVSLVGSAMGGGITTSECNPANATTNALAVLANIINWFSWLLAILSVAMGLYAGFLYITGRGEPQKIATAGNVLLYTVIGVVVAILAFSIKTILDVFIVKA